MCVCVCVCVCVCTVRVVEGREDSDDGQRLCLLLSPCDGSSSDCDSCLCDQSVLTLPCLF